MADDNAQRAQNQNTDADVDQADVDVVDADKKEDADKKDAVDPTVTKAEFDQLFARMQAADRAKNAAEKKLSDIEKAKLGDVDKAKLEADEATKKSETLATQLQTMRIENAFFRENKYTWHDASDAIAALDMSKVTIGEDGKVEGLKAAIDDVAKRKPHFVKTEGPAPVATGSPTNGTRKGEKPESGDRAVLAKRFPALRK